ncbi:hypothetical protein [Vreelandella sp. GE22]
MAEFIKEYWAIISAYPVAFMVFGIVVFLAGFGFSRILLGGALSACKERLEASKDDAARLKGEKDNLAQQLTEHGESIDDIKAKLADQPKIYVSSETPSPDQGKDGDIWFQHEK